MKVFILKTTLLILLTATTVFQTKAQDDQAFRQVNKRIDAAQAAIVKSLSKSKIDKDGREMIRRFVTTEIDSMRKAFKNDNITPIHDQLIALNCATYFLENFRFFADFKL